MTEPFGIFKRLALYVKFRRSAKNRHGIHSPLIFSLVEKLRKANKKSVKFAEIEKLRSTLYRDESKITFSDLGANGVERTRSVSTIARTSAKSRSLCLILSEIVDFVKPEVAVEIGTSLGLSLGYQLLASPNTTFVSIEGSPEIAEKASSNLSSLGLFGNIKVGHFDRVLPTVLSELETIDFAFVDGNHHEEPTLRYFNQLIECLTENGCIVFDDIYWSQGMQNAWNQIIADERVRLSVDLYHLGIIFIRPGVVKQHFKVKL